jgi:hypothetical protein
VTFEGFTRLKPLWPRNPHSPKIQKCEKEEIKVESEKDILEF